MSDTPSLALAYIEEGQVGADVSYNTTLAWLDFLHAPVVLDDDLTTPPGSPTEGDTYIPAATATGAWAGHEDDLARYINDDWIFLTPSKGVRVYVDDETAWKWWNGSAWASYSP